MVTSILPVLALLAAAPASAGEIFGTLTEGGKPVGQGVALKIACDKETAQGATDEYGSYSLKVPSTGKCTLTASYKDSTPGLLVTLYEKPVRYDLILQIAGGKSTLTRK